jgi:N-acetylglutamate synthase/N-acetylornithine aminotransferase
MGDTPMNSAISPLAPKTVPEMPAIDGVRLATAQAGIRYVGRTDVLLALFDDGTTAAGVFTRSKCPSAPVEWCRAHLKGGKSAKNLARALVVNSGNANERARGDAAHRADRRQGGTLQAGGDLPGLNRRNRRAA